MEGASDGLGFIDLRWLSPFFAGAAFLLFDLFPFESCGWMFESGLTTLGITCVPLDDAAGAAGGSGIGTGADLGIDISGEFEGPPGVGMCSTPPGS